MLELHKLLYTDELCACDSGREEVACTWKNCAQCGGTGKVLTELGVAFWDLAKKAAENAIHESDDMKEWLRQPENN